MATRRTSKVAAFCSSEPEAGSDVANMLTTAKYDEASDEWMISGQKAWVTNGGVADVLVVQAVVEPGLGARGQAAFVMSADTAGIAAPRKLRKHGLRASNTADIFFDCVRVPGSALLGGKDKLDEKLAQCPRRPQDIPTGGDGDLRAVAAHRRGDGRRSRPRRLRVRTRLREGAGRLRATHHREASDLVPARRHRHRDRRGAAARAGARPGWAQPARNSPQRKGR